MHTWHAAVLALVLSQSPDEEAAPAPAEPPPAAPAPKEAQGTPAPPPKPKSADEVQRIISKLPSMSDEQRAQALEALARQFGSVDNNPVLPSGDTNLERYLALQPAEQGLISAREFLEDLIAGDAARLMAHAGLPFFLEGRRVDRAEELRTEWSKALRSRRTDLLTLYGIEVLTPAEMEKKYGRPPQRLNAWPWRAPNTLLAVANLSGHATILLLRQVGAAWQVVGFHD